MPADYNIPMTDAQITEALQLMVERVSEGWAQETYDGSPVGSGSPYYHKSSKWWATQAANAAARAEAAVPAGTAGAVFFDRAQSLTSAQQEQARQNIKAGGSNKNLLDNPWFTVNQRGQSSYLSGRYTVDRWYGYQLTTDVNNDGSITITPISAGTGPVIQQRKTLAWAWGKTVVVSILNGNETIDTWKTYIPSYATLNLSGIMSSGMRIGIQTMAGGDVILVIYPYDGNAHTIKAVKLEIGSVSTLANDILPNYTDELIKCISSTADPADTYANKPIGATPNPNLLDNPWWGSWGCINQRGFSTVTDPAEQYTIDRWKIFKGTGTGGTLAIQSSNAILFNNSSGTAPLYFRQLIGNDMDLTDKVVTLSIKLSNGTVYSGTGTIPAKSSSYQPVISFSIGTGGDFGLTVARTTDSNYRYIVQLNLNAGVSYSVSAVKLELGSVSTLANDAPPAYAEELAKCQRYLYRWSNSLAASGAIAVGIASSATVLQCALPVPLLRKDGTLTATQSGLILACGDIPVTNVTVASAGDGNDPRISLVTAGGLNIGSAYLVQVPTNAYLQLSKEL